jgi:hypothetical protein
MYNEFIGREVSQVTQKLDEKNIKYIIKDNNSGLSKFDTELVVRIKQINENKLELTTSKFLINI